MPLLKNYLLAQFLKLFSLFVVTHLLDHSRCSDRDSVLPLKDLFTGKVLAKIELFGIILLVSCITVFVGKASAQDEEEFVALTVAIILPTFRQIYFFGGHDYAPCSEP